MLCLASCVQKVDDTTPTHDAVSPLTTTPRAFPTVSVSKPTLTPTHVSTLTPSPSAIPPSLTPIPTLAQSQREDYWLELISTNVGCKLPCWWGIHPAESRRQEIVNLFAPIGVQDLLPQEYYRFPISVNQIDLTNILLFFTMKDDLVSGINVFAEQFSSYPSFARAMQRYALNSILSEYGKPSQVILGLRSFPTEPDDPWPYRLGVFYDDVGILVYYEGTGLAHYENHIRVCPQYENVRIMDLYLQSPTSGMSLTDFVSSVSGWDIQSELEQRTMYVLEEATDLDLAEFQATFSLSNTTRCFETPTTIWP